MSNSGIDIAKSIDGLADKIRWLKKSQGHISDVYVQYLIEKLETIRKELLNGIERT